MSTKQTPRGDVVKELLMIPGPVEISESVLERFCGQPPVHYGSDWAQIYKEVQRLLRSILNGTGPFFIMPGSGSLAIESICATFCRDRRVLVVSNGWFGERLYSICSSYTDRAVRMHLPHAIPVDATAVRRELRSARYDALFVVHVETSTATLNPLEEIACAAREEGVDLFVDGVSSAGIERMDMGKWGIDAVATASQKGLECPPGLGIVGISSRLIERACKQQESWFVNLGVWLDYQERWADWHPFPMTLPTNVVMALKKSLEEIIDNGGISTRIKMFDTASQMIRNALSMIGLKPLGSYDYQCHGLTAIDTEGRFDPSELLRYILQEHHIRIAGTLGELSKRVFRIGHMSTTQCSEESLSRTVAGIREFLNTH